MSLFPAHLTDRYQRFKFRHFGPNIERYSELAAYGQQPETMIISCCDSRVDPETIFSAMPGELFVVRNVANLVPPFETTGTYHGVSAALEFAALNLRVKDIVVMGHSSCGGIRACVEKTAARQSEAQFISNWMSLLDDSRARVEQRLPEANINETCSAMEWEAIRTSLKNLRTFPCIQILEGKGRLSLHGTHFDIASGTLTVLNQATDAFVTI